MKRFAFVALVILCAVSSARAQGPIVLYRFTVRITKAEPKLKAPPKVIGYYFLYDLAAAKTDLINFEVDSMGAKSSSASGAKDLVYYSMPQVSTKVSDAIFVGTDADITLPTFRHVLYFFQGRPQTVLVNDNPLMSVNAAFPTRMSFKIEFTAGFSGGIADFFRYQGTGKLDLIHTQEINRNGKTMAEAEQLVSTLLVNEGYPALPP
jgi:hypothetical protein